MVARAHFGVWLDIGVGHPALLLLTKRVGSGAEGEDPEDLPPLGARVFGQVDVIGPDAEIGLTQRVGPPSRDDQLLWSALRSAAPVEALKGVVLSWKAQGVLAAEAEHRLTAFLHRVLREGQPDEDDPVRDVLDFVTGFCSPHARLFP